MERKHLYAMHHNIYDFTIITFADTVEDADKIIKIKLKESFKDLKDIEDYKIEEVDGIYEGEVLIYT